jgi:aerobic-type carbon monoxide dehydrogenase small subunit (CoxS/CutS family)
MTEKKNNGSGEKTRREFLKDAGLLIGGTAIGSTVLLAACGGEETTKTVTTTAAATTITDTTTVTAAATTVTDTTTVTAGATTVTDTVTESRFVCPIDQMEFDTFAELQAHFEAAHPGGAPGVITLNINGIVYMLKVEPDWTLAYAIREKIGLTGTKRGCRAGDCGACTVIMNGLPILSCLYLAIEADGAAITTVEGLAQGDSLSTLQQAFIDEDAVECGFCTPGMLMSAKALLDRIPNPSKDEIKEFMAGNLCRCGIYREIIAAIQRAA